ncbi:MAG: alpha/beta fold hydrolase [Tepidisphaeraceae bacterium]|jgi:cephalosporin-C deacetylase
MPSIDMPLDQLRKYQPSLYREDNFEQFWKLTVAEALSQPLNAELIPYNLPVLGIDCFAIRFDGFRGGRLAGWYIRPQDTGTYPGVVVYHGYSGRGTRPLDLLHLAGQGMCVLSLDCRGQNGQSTDAASYPEGHYQGWMTLGIRDPQTYYYRFVYADALRALEVLATRQEVDSTRLAVTGGSQGGGISLAVAALSERPMLALPDIPFLCDFRRGVAIAPTGPYPEIASFIKTFPELHNTVFRTLSYFDCLNLAPWIKCRTLISNCLWDDACPPSTIFAVYHQIHAEKTMEIYPYHKHEIPYDHNEVKFRLITSVLTP